MASMRDSVVRLPDGRIALRLVDREREILRALLSDLVALVGEPADPPGMGDWEPDADDDAPEDEAAANADAADSPSAEDRARRDPALDRLYPDARPDDVAWSARFRDLIRGDLDDARRANLAVVAETLEARTIDDSQAEAWLHVLNDLRLVMGTRLEVTQEDEEAPFDPEDEEAAARIVYAYTGWLEGQFVDVLAAALPPVPGEDVDPDEGLAADDS